MKVRKIPAAGVLLSVLAGLLSICVLVQEPNAGYIADKKTYLADVSGLLKKQFPANRTVTIVCHGHSVPAGYFKTPVVDTFNAYPHLLHKGLKNCFPFAVINVIVTAISGETSERGAARFEKDVLLHNPDVVTIDYALNDREIGLERTKTSLVFMIGKAKAKGIKIILLTPTGDMNARLDDPKDPLNKQAELIRGLAKEQHIGLVDSLAVFQSYVKGGGQLQDLMSQWNHPNRKGHDLVAEKLLDWFPK